MNSYTALIVDLKKSKTYRTDDRNSIQKYIYNVIQSLNTIFEKSIAKKVDFSGGDEIQGLFCSSESAYLFLRLFNMLISPVEVRAGMGVGEWDVIINNASTTAQDGSAYHNARYAIENTKDTSEYSLLLYSGKKSDFVTNSLINYTTSLSNKHNKYQNEVMLLSELLYPINVHDTINKMKFRGILDLLFSKNKIPYYFIERSSVKKPSLFESLTQSDFQNHPLETIDALDHNEDFFITAGKKRGLATELSELIGVRRQTIEKTIKTANIYEIRNSTITTLKFMNMSR